MEKMKSHKSEKNKDFSYYLPQSENEWLATNLFEVSTIDIHGKSIRCAFSCGAPGSQLVTMVGGIPRDLERRKQLPLINKLYGHIAVKRSQVNESSVMYNQTATGGSGGDWDTETLRSRIQVVEGVTKHFSEQSKSNNVAIIGTSAGAYMAIRSLASLNKENQLVKKLVLIFPGFYPTQVEDMPYGETFKQTISSPWDIKSSPIFDDIKNFVENGGEVLITFFESDDPPIPLRMQEYCKQFVENLKDSGCAIEVFSIPGVAHNFRTIGSQESKNVVDNTSVRETAVKIISFLSKE